MNKIDLAINSFQELKFLAKALPKITSDCPRVLTLAADKLK